ncbi:IS5 family transposase [Synechococcus sp. 1G10]|uniref:IS5 family transposase n=1 Tax=Synechococcus sp. 1G10 TaxID=2025605 RepID=UPI001E2C3E6B|nr:IS5 family transposase [Synechococcus sp. 1G10]
MYRREHRHQLSFENFFLPFGGKLSGSNRWIKLVELIPWEELENDYASHFSKGFGAPAKPFRMALGALIIKARLAITDEELVEQIKENPYLQFFIGLEAFQFTAPFDPSMMVYFRKRLPESVINDCNERIVRHGLTMIQSAGTDDDPDTGTGGGSSSGHSSNDDAPTPAVNQGTLLIDATCVPVDIRYPTDLSLLNEAREVTEKLIDAMHPPIREAFGQKPRTHCKKARQQFLAVAKKKRPRISKIRKAIKQQLGHLERNLASIDALIACGGCLLAAGSHWYHKLLVVSELVRQQKILYHSDTRSIPDRVVSLFQSHIRPIVRGKARCNVEFGAKISISVTGDGFTYLDRLSYDPYNEGEDLKAQAIVYRRRHGHYPEVICADQIYRTRANRAFCQRHGIRLSGPRLGRPKSDPELVAEEKRQFLDDQRQRNAVEGKIGQGKRRFGLGLIREKLAATQGTAIALAVLVMNLEKLLELLFVFFSFLLQLLSGNEAIRRAEEQLLGHQAAAA